MDMTPLLLLLGVVTVANTVLLSLIYLTIRDTLHTRAAQGSTRRQWIKQERD